MAKFTLAFAFLCIFIANSYIASATILSWLTGSGTTNPTQVPDGGLGTDSYSGGVAGAIPNQFQEETGECSHWGDTAQSPYPPLAPSYNPNPGLTSSGELTGSHQRVPVGTIVAITNIRNGNTVSVRVVPPKSIPITGRIMELSPTAFSQVANLMEGIFTCSVRVVQTPRPGGYGGVHSLSSYTVDNPSIRIRPGTTGLGQLGPQSSSLAGSGVGMYRTNQYAYVSEAGVNPLLVPPYPPVHIGSGYYSGDHRQRLYGTSAVTAWNPEGEQDDGY